MQYARRRFGVLMIAMLVMSALVIVQRAPSAQAADFTESYTDSIPNTLTNWTDELSYPQFDASQGTLLDVTVEFTGNVAASMSVENTSTSSGCNASLQWGADFTVTTSDGDLVTSPRDSQQEPLSVYDGVFDFAGTSGISFSNLTTVGLGSKVIDDPAALADFIGTGTIDVPINVIAATFVTGCGNIAQELITSASAEATVVYHYETSPAIEIEKHTNGEDADTPTGPEIPAGDDVLWEYIVTNTGDADLTNVVVVDDQGVAVTCPQDTLAVDETMTCTGNGTAEPGQYANVGSVTGEGPGGEGVEDSDPSHYFGTTVPTTPAIDIEKHTNGEDADTPTGPEIPVGDAVLWEYFVTNTGDEDLTNVVVVDDQGVAVTCPQDTLAVGETMTCTGNGTAELGQYANVGTATGDGTTDSVEDSDPSHYIGTEEPPEPPAIDIEKHTNGYDADTPTGPYIPVGDAVLWEYFVTNTGDVDLTGVTVVDDQGVAVTCPQDTLAVGETMTCTGNGTAELGQYANIGSVEGTDPDGTVVEDSDPSHYVGTMVMTELDCSHGDVGCLGIKGEAPGPVEVFVDGQMIACNIDPIPGTNRERFKCMLDSRHHPDPVDVEVYSNGNLIWVGLDLETVCVEVPAPAPAPAEDDEVVNDRDDVATRDDEKATNKDDEKPKKKKAKKGDVASDEEDAVIQAMEADGADG